MRCRGPIFLAAILLALLAFTSTASADLNICSPGTGAGQCESPQGLATDFETGRLYVADQGNNRIDVFEADGTFVRAFGWGVDTGAKELQSCTTASTCQAGIAGSGVGQFDKPTWIAVDNDASSTAQHDVYVGTDNFRVQRFKPTGEFVKAFGSQGTGACQFNRSEDPIAVGPGGDVYVADSFEAEPGSFTNRVERFDSEGTCKGEVELFKGESQTIRNFAVDSQGNSYLTVAGAGGVLRKYSPAGALLYERNNGSETEAEGIAIDGNDNVFAKQRGEPISKFFPRMYFITEYDSSGAVLKRFDYVAGVTVNVPGLAAYSSAGGDLFASREPSGGTKEVSYRSFPPPGPVVAPEACRAKEGTLGNITAVLLAAVNPEGKATTVHFEYVTEEDFDKEGFANPQNTAESPSIGSDFEIHEAAVDATLEPETEYRCRVVATNADGSATGQEGSFMSLEPLEIGPTTVSDVETEAATLNAQVNPLGIPTSGFFEYVEEATYLKDIEELGPEHGFDHASKAPGEALIEFGAGKAFVAKAVQVSGLKPGTSYRFRVIATNGYFAPGEGVTGETEYLRTYAIGTGGLPDDRAWELVSPGQKNSAEVAVPGIAAGVFEDRSIRIQAGSSSGEAITYTSFTSFGDANSAPATSQYLSKRTLSGWKTANISPLGVEAVLTPPFTGFTADLGFGAFTTGKRSLTPDCPEGFQALYLRDNESGALRCLTPEAPASEIALNCFSYAGASADGDHVFFTASASYAGAPQGQGYSLYEWSAANGPQLVSILPNGEAAEPTDKSSFGAGDGNCQTGQKILRHAISVDGSRAFWTYVPKDESKASRLLVRVNGSETTQLDALPAKKPGSGPAGNGVFWAAGADGSVVYFTDENRLISGSKSEPGKPDLYRYELGKEEPLTNLTKGPVAGDVSGVVGASDDGSYLYFVARAVLSGEEANSAGLKAVEGKDNLYLHHEGKTSFIATLAPGDPDDSADWSEQPKSLSARVTPDGRHLAFLSKEAEALAGYGNRIASGEHCTLNEFRKLTGSPLCLQAFVYDADTAALTCASCNPSGSRPLGPTVFPGWTNVYEGPRYLSNDGRRFFFESYDALSVADENGKRDVYEFERPGAGSCSGESPAFDPVSGGCHFLASGGKSTDETFLVDASSDGRDVFFSTRSRLVGWDPNTNYDVYDAREGGGFPEPVEHPVCQGEACKSPAGAPPGFTSPAGFEGPPRPQSKKPGKKHKKKKHKQKAKKKHGRAAHKRGAGR